MRGSDPKKNRIIAKREGSFAKGRRWRDLVTAGRNPDLILREEIAHQQKGKYCEDWERFPLHGVDKLNYYRQELDRAIALDNN